MRSQDVFVLATISTIGAALVIMPVMAETKVTVPIKVFVFTAAGKPHDDGLIDPDQNEKTKQRLDSVKDVKEELAGDKKLIQLVQDKNAADVIIEVTERGERSSGVLETRTQREVLTGDPVSRTRQDVERFVRLRLQAGDYSTEFEGRVQRVLWWRIAAENAGDQVKKWIQQNYNTLIGRRSTK